MRIIHFESLKPVCPHCKITHFDMLPLRIANVIHQTKDCIMEGNLICSNKHCQLEFPIIDGIPIIVSHIKQYLNDNLLQITARNDFSLVIESMLGDALGPEAAFNNIRHFASSFSWDHYADKAPNGEFGINQPKPTHSGAVDCLNTGLALFKEKPRPPFIDMGCAVGRTTFEIAEQYAGLTLGIDINFWMLRMAQRVLRENTISFPLKQLGITYERHQYQVNFKHQEQVDFWACDALALPFEDETFHFASALNVLDIISSPQELLLSIRNILHNGGSAVLATPYDWLPRVPVNNWIGGHSQRAADQGASDQILKKMLSDFHHPQAIEHLTLVGDIENHPWNFREHSRRTTCYHNHILACKKIY